MQKALEALEVLDRVMQRSERTNSAITALRQALAEPEQEPVAWMKVENFIDAEGLWDERVTLNHDGDGKPLYTAPTPQHDTDCHLQGICQRSGYTLSPTPRKPLTDEEIADLWDGHTVPVFGKTGINPIVFARAIERHHGITNQETK